ncbi:MAG TPA: gamma-glutamylcyclotransferase [Hyphomicrobiales bacterium]|nr:gamma-glutamylcyclotransferase [Hyphomicrobiales bacterium]
MLDGEESAARSRADDIATQPYEITRERLRDPRVLDEMRARQPGMKLRTDAELDASLHATLAGRRPGEPVWVFGYGSLIWNPAFEFAERRVGLIHGWHRRFCLWMISGRGSPEVPGLMLALDRGGSCRGIAYRLSERQVADELILVWRREMLSGVYHARWVEAATATGPVRAITFTANRAHDRFVALPEERVAEMVGQARGALGSCRDYLDRTVEHLETLGFRDAALERIRARVGTRGHP